MSLGKLSLEYQTVRLAHLKLGREIVFGAEELLALMFGEQWRQLVPQHLVTQITDSSAIVGHLEFDRVYLTPICSSLQQLLTQETDGEYKTFWCEYEEDESFEWGAEALAFIFRHFPRLQKWDHNTDPSMYAIAVQLLHKQYEGVPAISQSSSGELGTIRWTTKAPFQGNHLQSCLKFL